MQLLGKHRSKSRRLKKQPPLQRMDAAAAGSQPRVSIPKAARRAARRRRRSGRRSRMRSLLQFVKAVVTSPRWISLGLLVLSVYALSVIGSSPDFYLTRIPVEGVLSVAPEEIVSASGLAGRHIFAADPAAAAETITATPGIVAATVTLRWPNQVNISIVEDSPIAIWEQAGEAFWINAQGQLLPARINVPGLLRIQTDSPGVIIGMPAADSARDQEEEETAVEDTAVEDTAVEETATPPPSTFGTVPEAILEGALLLHKLQPEYQTFAYHPSNGLSYEDARGWRVYLGTGSDMAQKLAVHEAIAAELLAQNLAPQYISVSNQSKPFYMATEQ